MCDNLAPFFLLLLASRILKESISVKFDLICLVLNYACLMVIKFGSGKEIGGENFSDATFIYTFVFLNPALAAAG